jgi:hypothetical protein
MQRVQCPICNQEGVLQWKETITKIKGKIYRYKKLYVYHQHPKPHWCYLSKEQLKSITQKESKITQNNTNTENLNSISNEQNNRISQWAGSLARLYRRILVTSPANPHFWHYVL